MKNGAGHDVVVIGGGPAGAAAALALARAGRSVVLLERSCYESPRIGETVGPAIQPLLGRLGVWEQFLQDGHAPSQGLVSVWGSDDPYENDFIFSPYGRGWHLDRACFDARLAKAAEARGALVLLGHTVQSCQRTAPGHWIVKATGPRGEVSLAGRWLLDAGGRRQWPNRPGRRRERFDRLVSIAGYLTRESDSDPDRRAWVEAAPGGWWYTAPLAGILMIAAYLTDSDLVRAQMAKQQEGWFNLAAASPFTACRMRGARLVDKLRIVPAGSSIASPLAGPDWLAIGDAACAFDPLSGQGICQAIASGLRAAEIVPTVISESGTTLAGYCSAMAEQFRSYYRARQSFYLQEKRWPGATFWRRFSDEPELPNERRN